MAELKDSLKFFHLYIGTRIHIGTTHTYVLKYLNVYEYEI